MTTINTIQPLLSKLPEHSDPQAGREDFYTVLSGKQPSTAPASVASHDAVALPVMGAVHPEATARPAENVTKSLPRTQRESESPEPARVPNQVASVHAAAETELPLWSAIRPQVNVAVAPIGMTEDLLGSRVFGVHLLANTYLSELTLASDLSSLENEATDGLQSRQPAAAIAARHTSASGDPDLADSVAAKDPVADAGRIIGAAVNEFIASGADVTVVTRDAAVASSAAVPLVWPESLLRLTRGPDGHVVVWLRDYRVDGDDAARLVNALVAEAHAQGARLGRIVLNGRDAWIAQHSH